MNLNDFTYHYKRLWLGFRKPEVDLTPERTMALFRHYSQFSLEAFEQAIDAGLREAKFPSAAQLQNLARTSQDALRTKSAAKLVGDTRKGLSDVLGASSPAWAPGEAEAAKELVNICSHCWENGLGPEAAAEMLEAILPEHPSLRPELRILHRMGKHWRNAWGQYFCQDATPEMKQHHGLEPCDCEDCTKASPGSTTPPDPNWWWRR